MAKRKTENSGETAKRERIALDVSKFEEIDADEVPSTRGKVSQWASVIPELDSETFRVYSFDGEKDASNVAANIRRTFKGKVEVRTMSLPEGGSKLYIRAAAE